MNAKQIKMGVWALIYVIFTTTLWMWLGEKHMPYYGYWGTHEFNLKEFFLNLGIYMFTFDTWFWFTHLMFHHPFFWKNIHSFHHEFVETSAFA